MPEPTVGKEAAPALKMEDLKAQSGNLSSDQEAAIAAEADREYEKEREREKKEKKEEAGAKEEDNDDENGGEEDTHDDDAGGSDGPAKKAQEEKDKADKAEKDEKEKVAKAEQDKKDKEARESEEKLKYGGKTWEELSAEERKAVDAERVGKEEKEAKAAEEAAAAAEPEEQKKAREEGEKLHLKAIMESEKLSETEAKESLEKDKAILKKYKGNALEIARGYRNLQSTHTVNETKLKETEKKLQLADEQIAHVIESHQKTASDVEQAIIKGDIRNDKGESIPEGQILQACREEYPSLTGEMDDTQVRTFAASKMLEAWNKGIEIVKGQRVEAAEKKRQALIAELPVDAKPFVKEISDILKATAPGQLLSVKFDMVDVIRWAKGGAYESLKAEMQKKIDEAFKKGQEQAKILGEKPTPSSGAGAGAQKKAGSKSKRDLNDREKKRALEMFEDVSKDVWNDDRKYQEYLDLYPEGEPGIRTIQK